jgi:hypothetical protein
LQAWSYIRREVLRPEQPFELHQQLFEAVYHSWQPDIQGPAPVWSPQQQDILQTNVARFMSVFQVGCKPKIFRSAWIILKLWPVIHALLTANQPAGGNSCVIPQSTLCMMSAATR